MRVSLAVPEDQESLADLLCELRLYYKPASTVSRQTVQRHLIETLLGRNSPMRLIVASSDDGKVMGFAAVVMLHSLVEPEPDVQGQCLLKELFVSEPYRSSGVGHELMTGVANYAAAHGCSRIDWSVQSTNTQGRAFYERFGAQLVNDRMSYRLSRTGIEQLAVRARREADA